MVRNSNPGRGMSDGTPLGFIQQVIFEEEQQRKQYGNNSGGDVVRHEHDEHDEHDEHEDYYDEEEQVNYPPPTTKTQKTQSILKKRNVESINESFVEPIPEAIPALQEPKIQMNFTSSKNVDTKKGAAFVRFVVYTLIFSFFVFIGLYIRQYVSKSNETKTNTLNLLYMSLGIGVILSIIIYFTQNKIIKT